MSQEHEQWYKDLKALETKANMVEREDMPDAVKQMYASIPKFEDVLAEYKTPKVTIKDAVEVLIQNLKSDPDYYYGWQANIAMSIHDEWYRQCTERDWTDLGKIDMREVCNKGAKQFLDLLIRLPR